MDLLLAARRVGPRGHAIGVDMTSAMREVAVRNSPDLWAACIAGALPEPELTELALASPFREPRIVERFDCFRDTTAEAKVARDLHVHAVNFYARK